MVLKNRRILAAAALVSFFGVGCDVTTGKLLNLQLQQTKQQVMTVMGKPIAARGAMISKYGQVIEVWEYALYKTPDDISKRRPTFYWLYFYNGKLVQWGEAGDWKREADRIYELRFE
ncbi:MAG: hypothetical protein QN176_13795 [Armatimonadota bacterium]|nr:hypothetical protein [Armatimonadota bacterium]